VSSLVPAGAFDRGDLIPTTAQDTVALRRRLSEALASIAELPLRALVRTVFAEPGFAARFAECPATEAGHHAYLGGLLEHTVAVADSCERLARSYPSADRDLLIAAALLHDVGVVDALEFETSIERSDRGRLLGHAALGLARLERADGTASAPLGTRRYAELAHALAAHHGMPGAAGGPATLEALLLATADGLDASVALLVTETARAARGGAGWSDGASFGRPMLVPAGGQATSRAPSAGGVGRPSSGAPDMLGTGYLRVAG
jgi:3'-5' exoribonuclease